MRFSLPSSPRALLRRPRALIVVGLSASLLVLGACGKDSGTASSAPPASSAASSATPSSSASATPAKVATSNNLDKISVTGGYGKTPKVTVKSPWAVDKTRTTVLSPSKGAVVKAGQMVEVNYYGVDGRTGKKFDESFTTGKPVAFSLAQVVPGFSKGLVGQRQGSRVLIGMPGTDGYDSSGGNPDAGINVGDSLVFVVDLVGVQLSGPSGSAVAPKAGLPAVSDKGGQPVISIPKTDPPKSLVAQPLVKGTGAKVAAGDTITFNYRWVKWSDGSLLEESYSSKPASAALSSLLPGLQKGLAGQTVGSRVLLVIPPADGYPQGNATPSVAPDDTLVMVVDLLFTQAA